MFCPALPRSVLPHPALPCPALPCPALPCPVPFLCLNWSAIHRHLECQSGRQVQSCFGHNAQVDVGMVQGIGMQQARGMLLGPLLKMKKTMVTPLAILRTLKQVSCCCCIFALGYACKNDSRAPDPITASCRTHRLAADLMSPLVPLLFCPLLLVSL